MHSILKWKVHNGKIEIISFVVKFRHLPALIVNFEVYVKVCSRLRCTPMPHDCNVTPKFNIVEFFVVNFIFVRLFAVGNYYAIDCLHLTSSWRHVQVRIWVSFIEMLQYDWLWSGHMIIKVMFHIPMKLKSELARASTTTSDVNNQWRSNWYNALHEGFPIVNFPFICSNIPAAPAYGVCIVDQIFHCLWFLTGFPW
jgi:hypothetical protein